MHRRIFLILIALPAICHADNWFTFSLDNDLFIGQDDGYTNGVYFSLHEAGKDENMASPGFFVKPLSFFFENQEPVFTLNSYTFGQTMVTPEDITVSEPDPADVPYSGLLFLSNTFIQAWENNATKYSVAFGVVGPHSFAEESQKFVHKVLDSDKPMGWDHQLKNEFVVQLEYGKIWRQWLWPSHVDVVYLADLALGTVETSVSSGAFIRAGSDMKYTYITPSLRATRTSNPIAVNGGWFIFAGLNAKYLARQIFVDGNTFRDSPSIERDPTQFSFAAGMTYSWDTLSFSLAMENSHVFEDNPDAVSRYGSLTLAWKY